MIGTSSSPGSARSLADGEAVIAGKHHVEEDHVGALVTRLLDSGRPVGSLDYGHALRLEVHAAEQANRRLVVDYEHFGHSGALSLVAAAIPRHSRP
jgi:hypothetical protein